MVRPNEDDRNESAVDCTNITLWQPRIFFRRDAMYLNSLFERKATPGTEQQGTAAEMIRRGDATVCSDRTPIPKEGNKRH